MTDLITGNQIDIAAFDSGMSNDDKRKQFRGTRFADWVEDRGRDAVGYLQRASQDQEGIGDDILRGAGSVLSGAGAVMNTPGIKQAMQVLDAGSHYGGKLGGHLAKSVGIDPRIGGLAGNLVGDAVTGGFVRKAPKIAGKLSDQAASFAARNIPAQTAFALSEATPTVSRKLNAIPDNVNMKQLLELEDANMARADKLKVGDIKRSAQATITADPTDVKLYGHGQKVKVAHVPKELGSATGLTKIEGIPHKQIHHELMKDYYAEYADKARQLVKEGKATKADVINLGFVAKKHGFGLGDNKSAAAFIDKIPHDEGHEFMKRMGIQPVDSKATGKFNKTGDVKYPGAELTAEKKRISKIDNIDELTRDFEDGIREIGVPMRDEINAFQDAWERIDSADRMKLFQLRWKRDAANKAFVKGDLKSDARLRKAMNEYKAFKKKLKADMSKYKDHQKQRLEGISDRRMDELQKAAALSQ